MSFLNDYKYTQGEVNAPCKANNLSWRMIQLCALWGTWALSCKRWRKQGWGRRTGRKEKQMHIFMHLNNERGWMRWGEVRRNEKRWREAKERRQPQKKSRWKNKLRGVCWWKDEEDYRLLNLSPSSHLLLLVCGAASKAVICMLHLQLRSPTLISFCLRGWVPVTAGWRTFEKESMSGCVRDIFTWAEA